MRRPPYPPTRRGADGDRHHGAYVPDPYRWLEDPDSPETQAWVRAQIETTSAWLAAIPGREAIRRRLTRLWDYPRLSVPFQRGSVWFQFRNPGLANQPVLFVAPGPDDVGRALLDPNHLAADGTVAVTATSVSEDGAWLAYATSSHGSDWQTWRVRDVVTGEDLDDVIRWSRFAGASWLHDGSGFTYVALDPPPPGTEHLGASRLPRVWLHRLGHRQADDELLFEAPDHPDWLPDATVSDDGRFVVISIARGTFPETQVRVLDLLDPERGLRSLVADFESTATVVAALGSTFLLVTDHLAGRQRVMAVDLESPDRERWRPVIPECPDTLVTAHHVGEHLVCHYLRDASSVLRVHDLAGRPLHEVPVPPASSVTQVSGRPRADLVHFGSTSFTDSGSLWAHDLGSGCTRLVRPPAAAIDPRALATEHILVTSPDGTRIPLFLTRRRDLAPTGEVPVLLYGYGGFRIPITPSFSVAHAVWVERGGLLAVAALRGGGEYGRSWHDAGRLSRKQNVVDDFCACARWLAASGWSRPGRIAINGASNGGLLVGACLTQHPDLFGAAVAEVGVFDLLRFHRFTIGWAWTSDFGDPEDPRDFRWIRDLSPLHRIRAGRRHPPTLLTTADHDDRVVPAHSFKFAAALQAAQGGEAPILIRIETAAGHGLGTPTSKLIAERTDVLAFLVRALDFGSGGREAGDAGEAGGDGAIPQPT
ncbi:MAG TPA: prolyl oligopeptidase family serine peptidase [Candidatus Micrarchaeia archaeon]|nr:prolyl oligopeptidase family serine peptidase [Candidatus Micrarchaeia archaeon]